MPLGFPVRASLALVVLLLPGAPAPAQAPVATPAAEAPPPAGALAACDAHWARRAEGAEGARAKPAEIDAALDACRKAGEEAPDSLEPRWKLMRALYFKGEYTTDDPGRQKTIFDEGRKAGEEARGVMRRLAARSTARAEKASPAELADALKGNRDAVATFLWSAVDWGKWALAFGKSAAIKQGAAAKIRDDAAAVVRMDPSFEDAGGHRVLGRLHHQTPSVPFFTGWASRSDALANLEKAYKIAPKNFINRLYLADALWEYEKSRRDEARRMLEELVADTPSPEYIVEDRKTQDEARALLTTWKTR